MPGHPGNASDNRGPEVLAVIWTMTGLTTFVVGARMYIRTALLRIADIDDYLIVVSLILGLVYCGLTTANVSTGYGKHAYVLDPKTVENAIFLNCLCFLFGILSFSLPKLAVTALLNRILNPSLANRIWLWMLTGTAAVVSVICIIVLFTMCDPPQALWQQRLVTEGSAKCRDTWILIDYAIFTGAISAFVDLYLSIYPSTVLMRLHMSLRKRLALCAALGLGSVACTMAIIKCFQLNSLADTADYTYGTANLIIWTNIESNVVIIASCIPTLQPLLEVIMGKRTVSSYNNRYKVSSGRNYYHASSSSPSNGGHSKQSKTPWKQRDLTISNVESQESILRSDARQSIDVHGHPHGSSGVFIQRTDDVVVEYELRSPYGNIATTNTASAAKFPG